jgi:hypothetical protein
MADKLATEIDLATHLQQDVDTASATLALELATGSIQTEAGWRILQETVVGYVCTPVADVVTLPTCYLTALAMTDGAVTLVQGSTMLWSQNGVVLRTSWGGRASLPFRGPVVATFTHGYPDGLVPQTLRGICLMIAARNYDNPTGLRSEGVGQANEVKSPGGNVSFVGSTLTDEERRALQPWVVQPVAVAG